MSTDFPTTAEITADVVRALKATGVDTDAIAGDTDVRTPITGEVIFSVRSHTGRRHRRRDRPEPPRRSPTGGRCRPRCAASWSSAGASC